MSAAAEGVTVDPAARHPFGLPMGTIRGTLALLICGYVWLVLLWPHDGVKLPLAHFFLGSLVFMAFVTHPGVQAVGGTHVLPWLLRVAFALGSVGVLVYLGMTSEWDRVSGRLLPDLDEFKWWFLPYVAVTAGGFLLGRVFRLMLGNASPFFQSMRAWLSVLAMLMMLAEFLFFMAFGSAEQTVGSYQFLHVWQAVQLGVVSAYFACRT